MLKNIFEKFKISGTYSGGKQIGSGHIHRTYLINTAEPDAPDYILQKINDHVFPDIDLLMNNISLVINHLNSKKSNPQGFIAPQMVQTHTEKNYYKDDSGACWRILIFIPGLSFDTINDLQIAYEAGRAFGNFIFDLDDLPAHLLKPVIPGFHSLTKRFADFENALKNNVAKRSDSVKSELEFIFDWFEPMMNIQSRESKGDFILRVTHNDTKINNVLFNESGKAISVIDLDTVMPGTVLNDFGDAIRTTAASSAEDEKDLSKISIDLNIFKAFAEGFINKTHKILNPAEVDHLALSSQYITYMQAMRFLTDYLNGDKYYTINYPEHNIVRTRAQIRLAESMKENQEAMHEIVKGIMHQISAF